MIKVDLGESTLGCVLVACSEKGVCAISLGDDPDALVAWLLEKYPHAERNSEDTNLQQQLSLVLNYVEDPAPPLNIVLDIQGTAFQKRVWQALQAVPNGATSSYSDIAEVVGSPHAVRAVAGACAANSLALAIPCHRIVSKDGSLSGYRWGVERKKILLDREAVR